MEKNTRQWRPAEVAALQDSQSRSSAPKQAINLRSTSAISGARVNDLDLRDGHWLAATSVGLLKSVDEGKSWTGGPIMVLRDFIAVRSFHNFLVAATATAIVVSADGGTAWHLSVAPKEIRSLALTTTGQIMIATRAGGFRSSDAGVTWHAMLNGLPELDISSIFCEEDSSRVLAAAGGSIFESADEGRVGTAVPMRALPSEALAWRLAELWRQHSTASSFSPNWRLRSDRARWDGTYRDTAVLGNDHRVSASDLQRPESQWLTMCFSILRELVAATLKGLFWSEPMHCGFAIY